ncbi:MULTISPECIES: hypothetical protein [Nostoc cyanobionts]|uniref:hypothetical protein n=1 Tax=Nostoc cyanobionts TaxID=3123326 RepID=UPI0015E2B852|nr:MULTISPECIES: hypothetical protein [unclassified Nostoc]
MNKIQYTSIPFFSVPYSLFPTYADNYGYATLREQESNRIAADAGVAIGNRK